jgi:hypothetical protein
MLRALTLHNDYDTTMTNVKTRGVSGSDTDPNRPCGQTPSGKLLSWSDQMTVQVRRSDLSALHRAFDAAITHLDEARGTESRIAFAERLIRLKRTVLEAVWNHDEIPEDERSYDV